MTKTFSLWIDFKKVRMRKIYCTKCKKYKELKKSKISYISDFFLVFALSVQVKMNKIFKEEESIKTLNIWFN